MFNGYSRPLRKMSKNRLVFVFILILLSQGCSIFSYRHRLGKKVELPPPSKHPEKNLQFGFAMWYDYGKDPSLLHLQTNSKGDSLWIYDYYHGWKKINRATETILKNNSLKKDSLLNAIYKQ